ncbi:hypothetical protein [Staphylococcus gallinarum]|uniref:hypothetical protein n=1 Tax=Staphylococcus gallinarum TaxID=1293 RepID=UPI0030BAFDD1
MKDLTKTFYTMSLSIAIGFAVGVLTDIITGMATAFMSGLLIETTLAKVSESIEKSLTHANE